MISAWIQALSQALAPFGRKLLVTSLDRTCVEQLPLFCDGRGAWPRSYHLSPGLAFDALVQPYSKADQSIIGGWAKQIGLAWGGEFESPDPVHFDMRRYGYAPGDCSNWAGVNRCSGRQCLCPEKGRSRGTGFTESAASDLRDILGGSLYCLSARSETAGRSRITPTSYTTYFIGPTGHTAVNVRTGQATSLL